MILSMWSFDIEKKCCFKQTNVTLFDSKMTERQNYEANLWYINKLKYSIKKKAEIPQTNKN